MPPDIKPAASLDKPADKKTTPAASNEPVIHVIPEKFYGAGLKMKAPPTPPVTPGAPSGLPPVPGAPGQPPVGPAKMSGKKKAMFIAGGVLALIGIGVAAYFLAAPTAQPAPVANVNVVPPPPRNVCGDAKCEAPQETSANCSTDCGPPAPVCGNDKCEAPGETTVNCPVDCPLPKPVCGDNKCEAPDEDYKSCRADCQPPEPKPGVDTDSDGLTDQEEREVFGTEPANPNTDRDNFVDLNEILNLYDPAAPAPALLKDNPKIARYENSAGGYALFQPAVWKVVTPTDAAEVIRLTAPSTEYVEITSEERQPDQALMDWYLAKNPTVTSSQVQPFKTKQGLDAVLSPDRFTAYVDTGKRIVTLKYALADQLFIQYRVTFQTMIQSLVAVPVVVPKS